ncbi:MAG: exodeoxyribonuclease VII small subunit [Planctomycetes bacterium]|nr:exodeoxyribonuclease VII small subunit [Planctomycetota bacterium]
MAENGQKDVNELSFEETISQLTGIVSQIEQGQIPLQESIEKYERGMTLIKHCRSILTQAEKKIEEISAPKQNSAKNSSEK